MRMTADEIDAWGLAMATWAVEEAKRKRYCLFKCMDLVFVEETEIWQSISESFPQDMVWIHQAMYRHAKRLRNNSHCCCPH